MARPRRTVPRVRFTADYPYTPSADRRICTYFRAGHEGPVTQECAAAAIAAGVAVPIKPETADDSRVAQGTGDLPAEGG